jgi:translation elongation factor EF-Tu-like GTPase
MPAFAFTDNLDIIDKKPIKVFARLEVVSTEDGGRQGPFTSGYRPNHNFGREEDRFFFIGQVEVPEGEWVHPAETRELPITFLNARGLAELLTPGRRWRIQEGGKLVAISSLLSIE